MKNFDQETIDAKFAELLNTVEGEDLRHAMKIRLKRNAHLVTGAILFDESSRICLVQEAKAPYAGKWNLPLGHVEAGESLITAAQREVKEEAGYDIELTEMLPAQRTINDHLVRLLFLGKIIGGSPEERDQSDTAAVGWFTSPEIEQMLQAGQLRDEGIIHDLELYRTNIRLPLDTIKEIEYAESED